MKKEIRELEHEEFPLAEKVWTHYRDQKADPRRERIFGVFVDGVLRRRPAAPGTRAASRWTASSRSTNIVEAGMHGRP